MSPLDAFLDDIFTTVARTVVRNVARGLGGTDFRRAFADAALANGFHHQPAVDGSASCVMQFFYGGVRYTAITFGDDESAAVALLSNARFRRPPPGVADMLRERNASLPRFDWMVRQGEDSDWYYYVQGVVRVAEVDAPLLRSVLAEMAAEVAALDEMLAERGLA